MKNVCLGDTLIDKRCVYSLKISAGVKFQVRALRSYIILAATTIKGAWTGKFSVRSTPMCSVIKYSFALNYNS